MYTCVYGGVCVRVCVRVAKKDQVHVGTLTSFWGCLSARFRLFDAPPPHIVRVYVRCVCVRVFDYVFVLAANSIIYTECVYQVIVLLSCQADEVENAV